MSKRTILVANTDSSNLASTAEQLQEAGYNVITTSNANEALSLSQSDDTDLTIADIELIDAWAKAETLPPWKQIRFNTLFLVNDENRRTSDQPIGQRTAGYLIKPVDRQQLLPVVQSALECVSEIRRLKINEERLSDTIQRNREISVAIGIYMERFHTGEQEAFEALRSFARNERRKLVEIAQELIQVTEGRNSLINRINRGQRKSN